MPRLTKTQLREALRKMNRENPPKSKRQLRQEARAEQRKRREARWRSTKLLG